MDSALRKAVVYAVAIQNGYELDYETGELRKAEVKK